MISLMHSLPTEVTHRLNRIHRNNATPPASGFWHDGQLNLGPATCLAVTLSLICWAGIIGTGYVIHPFI